MDGPGTSGLRQFLVVILTFVLTLTGVGRGFAGTPSTDMRDTVAGLHVEICHSGAADAHGPVDPAIPVQHDCCDACALLAPAVLPEPPVVSEPASVHVHAVHARAVAWMPSPARAWSPRQSQGPPAA